MARVVIDMFKFFRCGNCKMPCSLSTEGYYLQWPEYDSIYT